MAKDTPTVTAGVNAEGKFETTVTGTPAPAAAAPAGDVAQTNSPVVEGSFAALSQAFELNRTREALPLGKMVRLRAVHGDLYHPGDNVRFAIDSEIKHEVDPWINLQFTYGKLDLVVD